MRNRTSHRFAIQNAMLLAIAISGCDDVTRFPAVPGPSDLPSDITDATITADTADGSAVLRWTAPAPGAGGELVRYDIRYRYGDPFEWDTAQRVTSVPAPGEPGTPEEYRFRYPVRGRTLVAAVRGVGADGAMAPPSNVARLLIPGITVSGTALELLDGSAATVTVKLITGEFTRETQSDGDGRWQFIDLPEIEAVVRIEGANGEYFPVEFATLLVNDQDHEYDMMGYSRSQLYPNLSRLALFKEAVGLRGATTRLRTWLSRPVSVYVPEFTTPGGVNYREAAIAAMERWMELTGVELFVVVDDPPAVGVVMRFRSPAEMGTQIGYTEHTDTPQGYPVRSDINVVNSFENAIALNRVMLHELGHTIRLYHLPAGFLMFGGQPLPQDPTADEVWIVRALASMRDGTDLSFYREFEE